MARRVQRGRSKAIQVASIFLVFLENFFLLVLYVFIALVVVCFCGCVEQLILLFGSLNICYVIFSVYMCERERKGREENDDVYFCHNFLINLPDFHIVVMCYYYYFTYLTHDVYFFVSSCSYLDFHS